MRHRIHNRKLNRTSEHRRALCRNMAQDLVEHGALTTTLPKAKNLRPYIERIITLAVRARRLGQSGDVAGALSARRRIHSLLGDRVLIPEEHRPAYESMSDAARTQSTHMSSGRRYRTGEPKGRLAFTAESITHRLIEKIAPRFSDRPGGYTRIIRLAGWRVGDSSPLAMVQLVGEEQAPGSLTKPAKSARRRRADARYAFAVQTSKGRGGAARSGGGAAKESGAGENDVPATT